MSHSVDDAATYARIHPRLAIKEFVKVLWHLRTLLLILLLVFVLLSVAMLCFGGAVATAT